MLTKYWALMNHWDYFVDWHKEKLERLLESLAGRLQWHWQEFTFLSVVIIVIILALVWLIILHLVSHKKMCSRAFWRGHGEGYKKGKMK